MPPSTPTDPFGIWDVIVPWAGFVPEGEKIAAQMGPGRPFSP